MVTEHSTAARVIDISPDNRAERPSLETLVEEITDDARVDPAGYLRDSLVPEGGE